MKRLFWFGSLALLVAVACALAGCATITKGTQQEISITCNVDGANLFLDGVNIGTTPFHGKVHKNRKMLKVEKPGYRTETVMLSREIEGMFWGNFCSGGLLGITTDMSNGAGYKYAPATYQIDMRADNQSSLEFKQQYAVRQFSMLYIDVISRDLNEPQSESVPALCELLGTRLDRAAQIEGIRSALKASGGDAVRFGNLVVDLI